MPTLAIHFARFGPYHLRRIESARQALASIGWNVLGLETGGGDSTYAWREELGGQPWQRVTVFPGEAAEKIPAARLRAGMTSALDQLKPEAVAIAGWGSPDARACLDWCRKHGAKAIVMSETREADGVRVWWKEWIKGRIIRRFDAALVGGRSHRDYLVKLGMAAENVGFGYNVVDNDFFKAESGKWKAETEEGREEEDGRRQPYFLASNRFIERKNLGRLVEAYGRYARKAETLKNGDAEIERWNLCLLGDGELKGELIARCRELGFHVVECAPGEEGGKAESRKLKAESNQPSVYFPGFRQIEELPRFYAHAGCFVHPALEEPWGLVINEAMACGLPILSGNNVGAAEELVDYGVNGWTFDAMDVDAMAEAMLKISAFNFHLSTFGEASRRLIEERCPTQAFGRGLAELLSPEP